jgi:phosphoribosylformylglycinamidine cyclo-ligase
MNEKKPISYKDAGVDIDAATDAIARAKARIEETLDANCLSGIGSFGGLYRVPVEEFAEPVLVSSTDSVGTKVKVAIAAGRYDTVGQDIVNHCVNDILVQGARPIFFLDYIGIGKVEGDVLAGLLDGLARACGENGCALIGGETAEMTDIYAPGEFDLVGTVVGVVDRAKILDGSAVRAGDRLVGLRSTGLHTNGYTLARKVLLERGGLAPDDVLGEVGTTVADALLAVHRSYVPTLLPLIEGGLVSALAHITGGGLVDNVPRVLPEGVGARIRCDAWEVPPIFRVLAERGPVAVDECFRAFNMGIGMVVISAPDVLPTLLERLRAAGEDPVEMGEVVTGERRVELL